MHSHNESLEMVELSLIDPSPYQHRRYFDLEALRTLGRSIQEDGLFEPIICRRKAKRFELIVGERRVRAARLEKIATLLARVWDVDDQKARKVCLLENVHRNDLAPLEFTRALMEWVDAYLLEVDGYAARGAEPLDRVRSLLGAMAGDRRHQTRKVANKFIGKVEEAFAALNRPVEWESFYNNDLPLLTTLDRDVMEFAIRAKLNKSQARSLRNLKRADETAFAAVKRTGQLEIGKEKVDIREASAREIDEAASRFRRGAGRRRAQAERAAAALLGKESGCDQILTGDFNDLLPTLAEGSIDLIFTDPPYGEEFLGLYVDLARHAARLLKPGGSLLVYAPHYALGKLIESMGEHLRYWWILCVRHGGPSARLPGKWIFVGWKPVLWFIRGGRRDQEYVADLIESEPPERSQGVIPLLHDWQQGLPEAEYLIGRLTQEGERVLDPMCGAGTTCLAALKNGRRILGIDKDPDCANVARGRIANRSELPTAPGAP
jgi:16S rRNA G966 N2-methylase RsmD